MAKQFIIAAMEEVFGEYILNISKDNLKIAALRGKIKLENVQLDGDLIGSHVLGALGLSGFGVLTCSAKSIKISVPWKNLEKEPTRFEVRGVHLVCVPLIPSTANKMYGSGTKTDPRCTLRTRAKRLVLARFERNFWNGQIQGEGPPMKRITRAVRQVELDWTKRRKRKRRVSPGRQKKGEDVMEIVIDELVHNLAEADDSLQTDDIDERETLSSFTIDDLPELPRDWKVKLREKVLRNMEASMYDVHIRCEVYESETKVQEPEAQHPSRSSQRTETRSFALGFTAESIVVRTANENWQVGSHEKRKKTEPPVINQDHLGPNEYIVMNNKIGYFNNLSIYWDDNPPILLAETDLLRGNYRKVTSDTLLSRISAAMDAMFVQQEPGKAVRKSLSVEVTGDTDQEIPHEYICRGFQAEVRSRSSDRTLPGPISCSADVLPLDFTLDIRPHQYNQYQMLRAAIKSQQRFDTMLRQRPAVGPKEDPREWWKYAIACVTSRPNSRPWKDVLRIVPSRNRYIELVAKKHSKSSDGAGFLTNLSESESTELLEMEELLPIEALLAFHLLALRRVYEKQEASKLEKSTPARGRTKGRFRILRGRSSSANRDKARAYSETSDSDSVQKLSSSQTSMDSSMKRELSLFDAMSMRLGRKVWLVDWRFHEVSVSVVLRGTRDDAPVVLLDLRSSGSIRSFGRGRQDFLFDLFRCDLHHRSEKVLVISNSDDNLLDEEIDGQSGLFSNLASFPWTPCNRMGTKDAGPDMSTSSRFLDLPPTGTVCRLAAGKDLDAFKLSLSAHPATLVWTTSLFDGLSEFISQQSSQPADITERIKNAATPLAKKAQLALLSPSSSALYVNIAAPKICIPIISREAESVLAVDAGRIQFSTLKDERQTDTDWEMRATGIQVNFIRDFNASRLYTEVFRVEKSNGHHGKSVLQPFSVYARSEISGHGSSNHNHKGIVFKGPVRDMNVHISPICLSLVDAEILARSFGKWYARIIGKFSAPPDTTGRADVGVVSGRSRREDDVELHLIGGVDAQKTVDVLVERMEIAIEGHSKVYPSSFDEKSFVSHDSTLDTGPPTRTYLVEVFHVSLRHSRVHQVETTILSVNDASIVRLRDGSLYVPFKSRRDMAQVESENCILVCTENRFKGEDTVFEGTCDDRKILRASFLRDRYAHLDEVEVDIKSVMLRVSPTTLKDCAKSFRRIVEILQVMTREMERKVHEAGRMARRRDRQSGDGVVRPDSPSATSERPITPSLSEAVTEFHASESTSPIAPSDSSILFKVTLSESTVLAGRPTTGVQKAAAVNGRRLEYAVIQVLSNSLIMFQSIENPDGTGTKTLHVSVDNVSSLVNTVFERVPPSDAPPMIGPFGAEFRVVYSTENLGCVVSQDVSLNCETVKSQLTPNDLSVMINITRRMLDRLRAFGSQDPAANQNSSGPLTSLLRYQKRGTGIVTRVNAEIHAFSFVLLRAFKSHSGAPEFLDFNVEQVKLRLEGCLSALSGDCSAQLSINSFNSEVDGWEYAVEPFPFTIIIDQMPNDLVINASTARSIQVNLTGVMLRVLAEMKFDFLRDQSERSESTILSPSALSKVGLRRATEARTITVKNNTGFDLHVVPDLASFSSATGLIANDSQVVLGGISPIPENQQENSVCLRLGASTVTLVGEREPVFDLPVVSFASRQRTMHLLRPVATASQIFGGFHHDSEGRESPETVLTTYNEMDIAYYSAEPVVEWCMHNQRLAPGVVDVFSLPKGQDLLSSGCWSCEDDSSQDLAGFSESDQRKHESGDESDPAVASPGRVKRASASRSAAKRIWLRPYLKNDSPEWTDMTCTLRMARDRVMLPDSRWIWVNDWSVDLSGKLGQDTDADGWEYEADFETFSRSPRYYSKGDACRRRRWTRTRMIRPPRMDDPLRELKFVWELEKDATGNSSVVVRSHLRVRNLTALSLSVFLANPSWDDDQFGGSAPAGSHVDISIMLASAVYMRLAKPMGTVALDKLDHSAYTERFMILPTSQTSSNYIRTMMDLKDVSGTMLHFLVEIKSDCGIVDVVIEPIFRFVNLLPCHVECRVGQIVEKQDCNRPISPSHTKKKESKKVSHTETLTVPSGKEDSCTAVNPWLKPHVSFRVPGYRWSRWQRIVNRKANSNTWRPSVDDEDLYFPSKGDTEQAEELTTMVRLERIGKVGDPLTLLLGVESGHCPTLRIYSQYWVVDRSGFGCHFSEGFMDLLGNIPDSETSRRSYILAEEKKDPEIRKDMTITGHQWSIGMSGMSMFFSKREKLTLSIEAYSSGKKQRDSGKIKSKWISPIDISNVMPKTVFSVDEMNGPRRFELALNVTVCPGVFGRTKMICLLPRYQIINLLHRELVIAQDGCLSRPATVPSQSTIPFHWEKGSLAPKIRLGAPSDEERGRRNYERCWSNGSFQLDRVGITSMRLPVSNILASVPMVVQTEVRLATKDQLSAVAVVIWSVNEKSNPLYMLRNRTRYTVLCRQPINEKHRDAKITANETQGLDGCATGIECGTGIGPAFRSMLGFARTEEFVWVLKSNERACFGFDDPERPHILEWTCAGREKTRFDSKTTSDFLEVDAMGSSSVITLPDSRRVRCMIKAEHSTKVIEFVEENPFAGKPFSVGDELLSSLSDHAFQYEEQLCNENPVSEDDDEVAFGLRLEIPSVLISVVDNADPLVHGREILLAQAERVSFVFSQTREGYHEFEFKMMTFQVDNHVRKSIHPILVFCPQIHSREPLLHMSAVRRLQGRSDTFVFRYAAIRVLEIEIYLDRRTAETIARFIEPLTVQREDENKEPVDWVSTLADTLEQHASHPDNRAPKHIEKMIHLANSGRIYFEQLHLHPVRIGLTFTQEWTEDWDFDVESSVMLFQFIRGMASIANAPLVFTSFVVDHVFEAPQTLMRVVITHYSSQLTKQVLGILGSLAILGAPADFITNVGTGVRDFFYEPIQGAVHGPRQFIEGLEAGTQSLARGVFVGVVRGAANVTEVVNANLAVLTADDDFIDERRAFQRTLTDAMSRGAANTRSFGDSLYLAGASVARGVKSGALGIVEQPGFYASKHGPVGFVKGVGKALVGAVVKPVVGVGDAAVLVMNHVSDATSKKRVIPKIPIRIRRALPSRSTEKLNCVRLEPYDERAAKAQKIVTGAETLDDVYIGHIDTPNHLVIASEQCLWAIDRRSREPWCVNWEEISHFGRVESGLRIFVFSQTGLQTFVFQTESESQSQELTKLLSMQAKKMANFSEMDRSLLATEPDSLSRRHIPGIKARQASHIFGSFNKRRYLLPDTVKDEADLVEQCFARVNVLGSDSPNFFKSLDEEAWSLVSAWGQVFSGLSSRRCIVASVINGTGIPIQIKSTKLLEGGSPCYSIPTKEYDTEQGVLHPGGVIIFFAWGVGPNLLQAGNVFMHIETKSFICELADHQSRDTFAKAMPGFRVGFLEKSYDESGWWAKYTLLVGADK